MAIYDRDDALRALACTADPIREHRIELAHLEADRIEALKLLDIDDPDGLVRRPRLRLWFTTSRKWS